MVKIGIPDTIWHKGIIAATVGWLIVLFGVAVLPTSLFGVIFFGSWLLLPISIYKDASQLREAVGWPNYTILYVLFSLIWLLAVIPGVVYLWKRRKLSEVEIDVSIETSVEGIDNPDIELPDEESGASAGVEYDIDRSNIKYAGNEYYCNYSDSDDGTWRAATGKTYDRETEHRFFLLNDGEIQFSNVLDMGQECDVANSGDTVVVDGLDRDELSSKLYAFSPSGEQRFSHFFNANAGACAISDDGSLIALSTYNPDCRTYVFEVGYGKQILEHENIEGNKSGLEFRDKEEQRLYLFDHQEDEPYYGINLDGEVVWKSEELQRKERLARLMDSSETDDLVQALELLNEAYELAADGNERKNVARKLADTHWNLAKEIKREEGDTDSWWEHLNQAKTYYSEVLPWYGGKQGVAKTARKQGKYYLKQGNDHVALEMFQTIADLEEEYDVQLLTDADERKLENLTESEGESAS